MSQSKVMVILFSEECNNSKQLKKELAIADHLNKPIVPVLIEETEPRGHFLYELAHRNWINVFPDPMSKLSRLADALIETLDNFPSATTPGKPAQSIAAPSDAAADSEPSPPPSAPAAPQAPPPLPGKLHQDKKRDFLPFRWADFIFPVIVAVTGFLSEFFFEGTSLFSALALALGGGVFFLALIGTIAFPIRYYFRKRSPYRVARMLLFSNLTMGVIIAVAYAFSPVHYFRTGDETDTEARFYLTTGSLIVVFLLALISFLIFFSLSAVRARRSFRESLESV